MGVRTGRRFCGISAQTKLDSGDESDGTLVVLTFEVRAVMTFTLRLSGVDLVDPDGERLFPRLEGAQVIEPR